MPKEVMHKLKLLYLAEIFQKDSDEEHPLTVADLIAKLKLRGVHAERKSIYSDIELLQQFGMDIITVKVAKANGYALVSREFELPELKLLVDAVQASKFITRKKSNELIEKIEGFASRYQANQLQRQVYVANRVKTMNESIYYTVDDIHSAITRDVKIRFRYFEWNMRKEKVLRHNGGQYVVSPWALTWDDENYYLVAFDSLSGIIKHYRVDKITDIEMLEEKREGREAFSEFDMAIYSKSVFGMFGGKAEYVELLCHKSLSGVILDRFGNDVPFLIRDDEWFEIHVSVVLSSPFYSWVFSFGNRMRLQAPSHAVEGFREHLHSVAELYRENSVPTSIQSSDTTL